MNLSELGGWPAVLRRLMAREDLTAPEAGAVLAEILDGAASPAQIAAFVIALRMKGETVEELAGMVEAMLDAAEVVPVPAGIDPVDTCGSGGSPTRRVAAFNVSTIASFVIAGAGAKVCKHGGRAATATSSSADLLEALGVVIELGPDGVARCIDEAGMGFCFAPRFHPAMRHAGPTRRELGVPTVFNFLGPLANPARVRRQVVGVSDPAMADKAAGVLLARGAERALVVHGHDGLDELTTLTTSSVIELRDGELRAYTVDPVALGVAHDDPGAVRGGDTATNVELTRRVLDGERIGQRDLVLLNAAAGLVAAGVADDLAAGIEAGADAIDQGRAARVLDELVRVSKAAEA
ncbi:MAG: Anthranilate phosphoribosyltransferase [Acidimicrobiales bacterium]|nr:Anthranilate phosphoribosyltransferase [Acidimicrobiales bacterium]